MADASQISREEHEDQITKYGKELPKYEQYAKTLGRVLANACRVSFPEALVQTRPKSPSSFAEKAARKYDKYKDAVNEMTDLCGGRVIVQTTEQVGAVKLFIEANFEIVEADDKTLSLNEDEFGYRDMHYVVQLKEDRCAALKITPSELATIGDRKAEIQVRTWVQHAWADTLHDRIYKNPLDISSDIMRTGALLSALLEESDRTFKNMADELDGLIANYSAIAEKEDVEREMDIQQLLLDNEPNPKKKPILAMKLAKLALAYGDDLRVITTLGPYAVMSVGSDADIADADLCELLSDLGYAFCRISREAPSAIAYRCGVICLEESLHICQCKNVTYAPHLRRRESLHARAFARLGWALEVISGREHESRDFFQQAHEHESANPYYLANMLGAEIYYSRQDALPDSMRTTIREAIKTCRDHAVAGIELPWAFFTAGRLNVLLGSTNEALGYYARGIRYCLAGKHCVPDDALDNEMQWLKRLHVGVQPPAATQRVIDLLTLGKRVPTAVRERNPDPRIESPVLIVAGGADSIDDKTLVSVRPLLEKALSDFQGTIIAGGTAAGIPGCVGDVAGKLAGENRKQFQLLGYGPARLPHGVSDHKHYDRIIHVGDDFLPEQILRNWVDILANGIDPATVMLLGIGGGPLSAVEYRVALGLGASVGIVMNTGGTADQLLSDDLWSNLPNLYPLPFDATTVRAFVIPPRREFKKDDVLAMGKSFHEDYLEQGKGGLPANMRPWDELDDTYRTASMEQAKYAVAILEAVGFRVKKAKGTPTVFDDFTEKDIERMAELEHGRWNVERLRNGWRYGKKRDNENKIHPCIVPWTILDPGVKPFDRSSVRAFPRILAQAGLEVIRKKPAKQE